VTGVTKTNQSTLNNNNDDDNENNKEEIVDSSPISLTDFIYAVPGLAKEILDFASARNWAQFHKPRNLVLALLGEVGELAEILQFRGGGDDDDDDDSPLELSSEEVEKLSQELADVSIYLLRLATVCQVVTPLCEALQEANTSDESR
jgi:NTP pyrophosphatase (non-canonical NTP hydrolase)